MADGNTDLLNQVLSKLDEQAKEIKAIRQEHGAKLDEQGRDVRSLKGDVQSLKEDIRSLKEGQETIQLKAELISTNQQRAEKQAQEDHMELMGHLINSTDQTLQAQQTLEKRVDQIERHLNQPPLK